MFIRIIGKLPKNNPYMKKQIEPAIFKIRKYKPPLIVIDTATKTDAKYPTHSVITNSNYKDYIINKRFFFIHNSLLNKN